MKTSILILIAFFFTSLPTKAQESPKDSSSYIGSHIFTLAPLGLINKIRIRYEYVLSKRLTIGAQLSRYHDRTFPGWQLVNNFRYYFSSEPAPFGLYFMGQSGVIYHRTTAYEGIYSYNSGGWLYSYQKYEYTSSHEVKSFGLLSGIAIGYQGYLSKRKHWTIDVYAGVKKSFMFTNLNEINVKGDNNLKNNESPYNKNVFNGNDGTGIGGFINCGINLGYRF